MRLNMLKVNLLNSNHIGNNNYLNGNIHKSKYLSNNISFGSALPDKFTSYKAQRAIKGAAAFAKLFLAFLAGLLSALSVFKFQNKPQQKSDSPAFSNLENKSDVQIVKPDNLQEEDIPIDKVQIEDEFDPKIGEIVIMPAETEILQTESDPAYDEMMSKTDTRPTKNEPDAFSDGSFEFDKNINDISDVNITNEFENDIKASEFDSYYASVLALQKPRSSDIEKRIAKLKQSNIKISNGLMSKMIINTLKSKDFRPYVSALNDSQLRTILSDNNADITTLKGLFEMKKYFTPREIERVSNDRQMACYVAEFICDKPKNIKESYYKSCIYRLVHTYNPDIM